MAKAIDLVGKRFGRLTVIERAPNKGSKTMWLCKCDCGNTKSIKTYSLTSGVTKSCGCYQSEYQTDNLMGQKFGRLTVIERTAPPSKSKSEHHAYWLCECDCGEFHVARGSDLKSGQITSCGCYSVERSTKHGLRNDPIYSRWSTIKARCYNPNNPKFPDYGGRGITMCDRWRDNVETFYEDLSKLPHYGEQGYSVNRIDNDGNYEPGNVEWSTDKGQANNKRNNHLLTYNGKTQTIAQWADEIGMNPYTLYNRILTYHWDVERALTEPLNK